MVRSITVCSKLNPKPFLFILRPDLSFRSEGYETWGGFAPTSRTNHRFRLWQSNAWDPNLATTNLATTCDCSFYPWFPEVQKMFLASCFCYLFPVWYEDYCFPVQKTASAVFPGWVRVAALVALVFTGEHLEMQVNIGTSWGTAHKHMVDIIPKKSSE